MALSTIDVCQPGDLLPPPTLQPDPAWLHPSLFLLFTVATTNKDICLYRVSRALNVPYCLLTSILTQIQQALWDFYVVVHFYCIHLEAFMQ